MQSFDIRTLILVVGILYVVMPVFAWVSLRDFRSRPVAFWCLGGLLMGLGAVLAAAAGRAPPFAVYEAILVLFMASHLFRIQALLADLGGTWRWTWPILGGVLLLLLVNGLGFGLGNAVWAAQLNNTVAAMSYLLVAQLARQIARAEKSRSALWIAIVYGLLSLAFVYRVLDLFHVQGPADMVANQLPSLLIALAGLLSAVIGHFGYVGLTLERALQQELLAVATRVRAHEEEQLGRHFARLDKRRSMGELSASLAHELSQPLTAILTNAQVVLLSLGKAAVDAVFVASLLEKIAQCAQRSHKILHTVRASLSVPAARAERVDLQQIVDEVVVLVSDQLQEQGIALVRDAPDRPAWVKIDPVQASQVVLNLFQNAIDSLALVSERRLQARIARDGASLSFRLQDTGCGLSAAALAHAGQTFFTSKPYGLGMGLSISRSIATQFGGSLSLTNAQGAVGAVAELRLPCLDEALA